MERYQEFMVAFLESIVKNRVKRLLAEDWRWRYVRLAIKHLYLGNHESQIKSYYGSLLWSLGRFVIFMNGLQDNEVLLQAGYDVIVILPPEGAPRDFSWHILKERTLILQ